MRTCTSCGVTSDDFYASTRSWCRPCVRVYQRDRRDANVVEINAERRARRATDPEYRERVRAHSRAYQTPERVRERNIRTSYGITVEEYDRLMAQPCGICGGLAEHLDHDHVTGAIRGPLCARHNLMLGHAQDDPAALRAGAAYLERHAASAAEGGVSK